MDKEHMQPVHCKNCHKLMFYAHVFVGEVKHKCGYTGQYQMMTETFRRSVEAGEPIKLKPIAVA